MTLRMGSLIIPGVVPSILVIIKTDCKVEAEVTAS